MVRDSRAIPQEVEDAFFAHVFTGLIIPHTSSRPKVLVNTGGAWVSQPVKRLAAKKGAPGPVLIHDNPRKIARDLAKLASPGTARVEDVSPESRRRWQGWLGTLTEADRQAAELTLAEERAEAKSILPPGAQAWKPAPLPAPGLLPRPAPPSAPRAASQSRGSGSSTAPVSRTPVAETPEPQAGPSGLNHAAELGGFHRHEQDSPLTELLSTRNDSPARSLGSTRSGSALRDSSAPASGRRSSARSFKSRPGYVERRESYEEEEEEEDDEDENEDEEYDEINEDEELDNGRDDESESEELGAQKVEDQVAENLMAEKSHGARLEASSAAQADHQQATEASLPAPLASLFAFPPVRSSQDPSPDAQHQHDISSTLKPRMETPRFGLSEKAQGKQRAVDPSPNPSSAFETPMLPPATEYRHPFTSSTSSSFQVLGGGGRKRKASGELSRSASRERAVRAPSPRNLSDIKAEAFHRASEAQAQRASSAVSSTPDDERRRRVEEKNQVRDYLYSRVVHTDDGILVRPEVVELLIAAGVRSLAWLKRLKRLPTKRDLLLGETFGVELHATLLEKEELREVLEDADEQVERWNW